MHVENQLKYKFSTVSVTWCRALSVSLLQMVTGTGEHWCSSVSLTGHQPTYNTEYF